MPQHRILLAVLAIVALACGTSFLALSEALPPADASLAGTAFMASLACVSLAGFAGLVWWGVSPQPRLLLGRTRVLGLVALLVVTALVLRSRELFDVWAFLPLVLAAGILEFSIRTRKNQGL